MDYTGGQQGLHKAGSMPLHSRIREEAEHDLAYCSPHSAFSSNSSIAVKLIRNIEVRTGQTDGGPGERYGDKG